jgi:hypothetical protein
MKRTLLLATFVASTSLNAQSFVAGWDFDDVGASATSMISNWGDLSGSATLTWTHDVATGPPTFNPAEFGVSTGFNSAVVNNTFAFVDPNTGYDQFSDPGGPGEFGFRSISSGDSFSFSFDGSGYTGLTLTYAVSLDDTQGGFASSGSLDLSSFDGNAAAVFVLNTASGALYDNFAITGSAVPEPSQFAAIAGAMVLGLAVGRRRRK